MNKCHWKHAHCSWQSNLTVSCPGLSKIVASFTSVITRNVYIGQSALSGMGMVRLSSISLLIQSQNEMDRAQMFKTQEASSPFNVAHSLLSHCILLIVYIMLIYNHLSLVGVEWKILSVKKEPILSVFHTRSAQSILPHTGNKGI